MLDVAKDWVSETKHEPGVHNAGINIIAWSTSHPEAAFKVIQAILKLTEDDGNLFVCSAAGPLEDFLSLCSDEFAELVFQVAEIDPRLRRAFQHVWQQGMTDARFKRVQGYSRAANDAKS